MLTHYDKNIQELNGFPWCSTVQGVNYVDYVILVVKYTRPIQQRRS